MDQELLCPRCVVVLQDTIQLIYVREAPYSEYGACCQACGQNINLLRVYAVGEELASFYLVGE